MSHDKHDPVLRIAQVKKVNLVFIGKNTDKIRVVGGSACVKATTGPKVKL